MKILDKYIIKTFFGPFFYIFFTLFFIFIVNIIWVQMSQIMGKGLTYWEIFQFLGYTSTNVVSMVLPLSILLASIMTFGEFGERYELAAMKAAGISLARIMKPLFVIVLGFSLLLFYFQNTINPQSQRKARNMLYNIATSKPALRFSPGQFVNQIEGYNIRFNKIGGKNGENIEGVFVHKSTNLYENQQTIIAKKGILNEAQNSDYLKLTLFDGYVYEDNLKNKSYYDRVKQENQTIEFDTMVSYFDVSELKKKALESQDIKDDYRFDSYLDINKRAKKNVVTNTEIIKSISSSLLLQTNSSIEIIEMEEKRMRSPQKNVPQVPLQNKDTLQNTIDRSEHNQLAKSTANKLKTKTKNKQIIHYLKLQDSLKKHQSTQSVKREEQKKSPSPEQYYWAYQKIESLKTSLENKSEQINEIIQSNNKMIIWQQRMLTYSFTCIIFFLIGSSLGSIIRKGGIGMPVVIAIVIFILFFVINLNFENLSTKGLFNPYIAAWAPNIIFFPFGIWLSYKALKDSQLFDAEKYRRWLKPIQKLISPNAKEHARYK